MRLPLVSNAVIVHRNSEPQLDAFDVADESGERPHMQYHDDLVLTPCSTIIVAVAADHPWKRNSGLVKPDFNLFIKRGITVPFCLVDALNGHVHLYLRNTSLQLQRLVRGCRVATGKSNDDHCMASLSQVTHQTSKI